MASSPVSTPTDSPPSAWRLAVPAAVTLGSVACAGVSAFQIATMGWDLEAGALAHPEHMAYAAWAIMAAEAFDTADGAVARFMRATSPFGLQLDSLADAMSFGAAPALLIAAAAGGTPWACAAALLVIGCAVVRVARYNTEKPEAGPPPLYFKGLATPGAGGSIAAWVLFAHYLAGSHWTIAGLDAAARAQWSAGMLAALPIWALVVSALMVSARRFADLPKHYVKGVKPWWQPIALVALGVATAPEIALALFFIGYALSGLFGGRYGADRAA